MNYWNPHHYPKTDCFPAADPEKYLAFDVDIGGLNNIRMAFEYVVVLAAISGRTLVLPPPQPWYLINRGPIHEGKQGGLCEFGELFDIDVLARAVNVISAEEFVLDTD